ncbi:MAG: hypothetical protein NTW21_31940 [Verrucomicrobia bacterium]|nr:hypothetical protein [Verrucomicrobiota bacterium]
MNALSDLFPKARAEILRLLFDDPAKESHLRDLARPAGLTAAALQRELANLTKGGLLLSRPLRTRRRRVRCRSRIHDRIPREILQEIWLLPDSSRKILPFL